MPGDSTPTVVVLAVGVVARAVVAVLLADGAALPAGLVDPAVLHPVRVGLRLPLLVVQRHRGTMTVTSCVALGSMVRACSLTLGSVVGVRLPLLRPVGSVVSGVC